MRASKKIAAFAAIASALVPGTALASTGSSCATPYKLVVKAGTSLASYPSSGDRRHIFFGRGIYPGPQPGTMVAGLIAKPKPARDVKLCRVRLVRTDGSVRIWKRFPSGFWFYRTVVSQQAPTGNVRQVTITARRK